MSIDDQMRNKPTREWIEEVRERYPTEASIDRTLTNKLLRRSIATDSADTHSASLYEQLTAFIATKIDVKFTLHDLKPLAGGASKEQYHFYLETNIGGAPAREHMMLRREPEESISQTDREREIQLFQAMDNVVPVPKIIGGDLEGKYFGRPAMVCSFSDGVTKPTQGKGGVSGIGNAYPLEYRKILAPDYVQTLARFHRFDPTTFDFSAFDIPEVGSTKGNEQLINWWARIWYEDRLEDIPIMAVAERWLRDNMPTIDRVSVVHGDYRTGNFLFDEGSKKITAVLDWELGWLGDYHADLAYVLFEAFRVPDESGNPLQCGLISEKDFLEMYQRESGLTVDQQRLEYFTIFLLWRSVIQVLAAGMRSAITGKSHQAVVMSWLAGIGYPIINSLRKKLKEVSK